MDHESQSSESNLVITSTKDRAKVFAKTYWRALVVVATPLLLLPIAFTGENNAYQCFYIFLVTNVYWLADVMHPCAISMVPVALSTLMGATEDIIAQFYIRNYLVDCLGVMILVVAIEHSALQRRLAVKMLLIFGCSHYRVSFLLFFLCTLMSMWMSGVVACGLMMPVVKGVLLEMEKMGILEMYHSAGKGKIKSVRHEESLSEPTDFTVFYFLGIAYSSTVGSMGTLYGSEANQRFKYVAETMFPFGPNIEFPHFMLLNLPAVILIEALLYLWMNFYFMGMFRAQSEIALEIGMSQEEAQYIHTLLSTQYQQLGKTTFHEWVVGCVILINVALHLSSGIIRGHSNNISSPSVVSCLLLFMIPMKMNFSKFFKKSAGTAGRSSRSPSKKACLNWPLVRDNLHWTVLFILGCSGAVFDSLRSSRMTEEFYSLLLHFKAWPAPALAFVIILFCKVLGEFAPGSCVAHCLLPIVGRLSVASAVHPHYLLLACSFGSSVPFHLMVGGAPHAMVANYVHISPWKMLRTGLGPSVISVVVLWFTCAVWSKAIWPDISQYPQWAQFFTERDLDKF